MYVHKPLCREEGKKDPKQLCRIYFCQCPGLHRRFVQIWILRKPSLSSTPSCSYKTQLLTGSETSYGTPALSITLLLHPNNLHHQVQPGTWHTTFLAIYRGLRWASSANEDCKTHFAELLSDFNCFQKKNVELWNWLPLI